MFWTQGFCNLFVAAFQVDPVLLAPPPECPLGVGLGPSGPHSVYSGQGKSQDPSELPLTHLYNGKNNLALIISFSCPHVQRSF